MIPAIIPRKTVAEVRKVIEEARRGSRSRSRRPGIRFAVDASC